MLGEVDASDQGESMMTSEGEPQSMSDALEDVKRAILDEAGDSLLFESKIASDLGSRHRGRNFDTTEIAVGNLDATGHDTVAALGNLVAESTRQVAGKHEETNPNISEVDSEPIAKASRAKFLSLLNDVERGHAFGTWSQLNFSSDAIGNVEEPIYDAISCAMMSLLEDTDAAAADVDPVTCHNSEGAHVDPIQSGSDVSSDGNTSHHGVEPSVSAELKEALPTMRVWCSLQDARRAIICHALAARYGPIANVPIGAAMAGAPLVLVIRESQIMATSVQGPFVEGTVAGSKSVSVDFNGSDASEVWHGACLGMAVLCILDIDLTGDVAAAVDAQLAREHAQSNLAPILVVIQANHDSTITAQSLALRKVCDRHGARMHLEGSTVMAVAGIDESLDAVATFQSYDTVLLEPAAWFGVGSCAVTTFHQTNANSMENQNRASTSTTPDKENMVSSSAPSLGPLFGLWTFLKRLGLYHARSIVSEATRISQILATEIGKIPNLTTESCGLGSTVRITYVMSRADRLTRKYKAREEISRVNKALWQEVDAEFSSLQVRLAVDSDHTWLVFSASRLVQGSPFSIPGEVSILELVKKLSETASKYEMSCIGSSPYTSRVCRLSDYQVVSEEEAGVSCVLSYGAFRIVPEEFDSSWHEDEAKFVVVHGLTSRLASTLATRSDEYNNNDSFNPHSRRFDSSQRGAQGRSSRYNLLPFEFFLHSNNQSGAPDFLTVETREAGRSKNPINEATMAAEFVISCVTEVCNEWRETNFAPIRPNSLANVAGLDTFSHGSQPRRSKRRELRPTKDTRAEHLGGQRNASTGSELRQMPKEISHESHIEREDDSDNEVYRLLDETVDRDEKNCSLEVKDSYSHEVPREHREALERKGESTQLEESFGDSPSVRSHWFGSSNGRDHRRRGGIGERNGGSKRQQNSDSSENSDGDRSDSDSGKSGDDFSDSDSEKSDNSYSGKEESSDDDVTRDSRKTKLRHGKGRDSRLESADESEESDSEFSEDRGNNGRREAVPPRDQPPPRRGLLSWWRGQPADKPVVRAESLDGSESSFASASDGHGHVRRNSGGSHGYDLDSEAGSESHASSSDNSHDISSHGTGRGSDDGEFTDEDSIDEDRDNKSTVTREQGVSKFGFNWLSKKVLPGSTGTSQPSGSSRSQTRAEAQASRACAVGLSNPKATARGRRNGRSRRYSSTDSEAESSHSESRNSSDEASVTSSDADSYRASQRRGSTGDRSKAAASTRGWFSRVPPKDEKTRQASRSRATEERRRDGRSRRSFDGSFSSESSDYEERREVRRPTGKGPSKSPASGSSVLSWFAGGPTAGTVTRPSVSRPRNSNGRCR